ncbi:MAG: 5-oxoprolinase subunit PxpA [Bacteroidota bacterium]
MISIDLNCDMGESWYSDLVGQDEALMPVISSCNLACGVHGGDPNTMTASITLALKHEVAIGAHPSLPGRENFGRDSLEMSENELFELVLTQVQRLQQAAKSQGGIVQHLKPHGALYHQVAKNVDKAEVICEVMKTTGINKLFGLPDSVVENIAQKHSLQFIPEGFIDRVYQDAGSLRSRKLTGAVIHSPALAAAQALRLAKFGEVVDFSGQVHTQKVNTLCIHGDHPEALQHARAVNELLRKEGIVVQSC